LRAVFWTIITVVLVVSCVLFLLAGPMWPGRKTLGEAQETNFRLWSGLWKKDDADRLR
jgi:hypothetical protein